MKHITLLVFFFSIVIFSQIKEKNIDSLFLNYTKEYEEVTYAHLNKSIFIQGEAVGFTIYVFHKHKKQLSKKTKNVYVNIYNNENQIVSKQLLKVTNGIANGTISLNKEFKKGNYTFLVFTNWMLNFNKQNIFRTSFKVLDTDNNSIINLNNKKAKSLDIQLLAESGHFLDKTINSVGVVVKDSLGFGVPNLEGTILSNKDTITHIKLNNLGITRFSFFAESKKDYKLIFTINNKKIEKNFAKNIANKGVLLSVKEVNELCFISLKTNNETLKSIKTKPLLLTFHDGKVLNKISVKFNNKTTITKKIPLSKLSSGITIFTVFNEKDKPISERLFFNYNNISVLKSNIQNVRKNDSLASIVLNYKNTKSINSFSNVSVSVLPKNTKSYLHNNTMLSQVFLKPYVKGIIENGSYYFKNVTNKTKYDLDNLLITQGWSSFDWTSIFSSTLDNKKHVFEDGLTLNFKIPEKEKLQKLFIHGTKYNPPKFIDVYKNTKEFPLSDFFLFEEEKLNISKVDFKGKLSKTNLKIDFYPKEIPEINIKNLKTLPIVEFYTYENTVAVNNFSKLNNFEILDGISLTTNLEKIRRQKIKSEAFGRVFFIDKLERKQSLVNFLNAKPGIIAFDDYTKAQIVVKNKRSKENLRLVLNGLQVSEYLLFNYWIDVVDYIEIDTRPPLFSIKNHAGGTVNIKTKSNAFSKRDVSISTYKAPLTFIKKKKFYIPKYTNYKDVFFKNYGVLDWLPKNKISESGNLNLSFNTKNTKEVVLFIEGITENGDFILDEKIIKID